MIIEFPYMFKPRSYQNEIFNAYFTCHIKRIIAVWHRRAGKSKTAINFLVASACQRIGLYYHMFPLLKTAKDVIWKGIDKEGFKYIDHIPKEIIRRINNQDMSIELINGSIIKLAGSDRYDSIRGTNPVGVIFDEFSYTHPLAWSVVEPILEENDGWSIFIYTPLGHNHGYDLYITNKNNKDWYVKLLNINDTYRADGSRVFTLNQIEKLKKQGTPEEMIQQEYFCSFESGLVGSYYSFLMEKAEEEGRICPLQIDPNLPLFSFWDIGIGDATAIWIMQPKPTTDNRDGWLDMVHYYENQGEGVEHYINYLHDFSRKTKAFFKMHFAPHDVENRTWVSGRTILEESRNLGIDFNVVPKCSIENGIQAVRTILPKVRFDSIECKIGVRFMIEYHKKYNEDKRVYSNKADHNWASHCADSFRYFALTWESMMAERNKNGQAQLPYWSPLAA